MVDGMVFRSYSLLTFLSVSSSTGKLTFNLAAVASAVRGSSSTLTPSSTKPDLRYFWYSVSRCGISSRHGPHQVAQKLTSTTWPRSSSRRTLRPSAPRSVKSGAVALGAGVAAAASATAAKVAATRERIMRMGDSPGWNVRWRRERRG